MKAREKYLEDLVRDYQQKVMIKDSQITMLKEWIEEILYYNDRYYDRVKK